MGTIDTIEHAYGAALAVLTAPVSFVEWTTLMVESWVAPDPTRSPDWSPVGIKMVFNQENYEWAPTREIEGERYIYVFSRRAWALTDKPTLVEELHLLADGQIEAAKLGERKFPDERALDAGNSPLPEKRKFTNVGKTMRFVRQWRGSSMLHYFFASRIPLSRVFVEELRKDVWRWVPATTFDVYNFAPPNQSEPGKPDYSTFGEWDSNVVTGQGPGALQVPVLDPITIASHLHLLAASATDDLYAYMTVNNTQSAAAREHVEKRQQKLVLGYLVQLVLKNYDKDKTASGELHNVSARADRYVKQYWEQVNYRIDENERWWTYLSNWYKSDPIHFLSRAHYEDPALHWLSYLFPMLRCLEGAGSSVPGRELVKSLIEDRKRFDWFQQYVLPGYHNEPVEDLMAAKFQGIRKGALAMLTILKEIAPVLLSLGGTEAMVRVLSAHGKVNLWPLFDGLTQITDPHAAALAYKNSVKELGFKPPNEHELIHEWGEITYHHRKARFETLGAIVEFIDLAMSLRQFLEERSWVNNLTLARSAADASAVLLEFTHSKRGFLGALLKTRPGIVVLAGTLEIVVGAIEISHARDKHDLGAETGALITITGAAISTTGFICATILKASAGPWLFMGLVVMSIGALVGWLLSDDPMDTFLKFCGFGADGGGGEIVTGLEAMEEGEYGQHIEVLLNLICMPKFAAVADDARAALVTMNWIPEGAKLVVDYEDNWTLHSGWFSSHGIDKEGEEQGRTDIGSRMYDFGKGGVLNADRQFPLMLSKAPHINPESDYPSDYAFEGHFYAQMHLTLGGFPFLVPPERLEFVRKAPPQKTPAAGFL